ncbi:MAG TPA: tetratricopeptide repeat protein [Thermoanaerobaculia bacterium]
MPIPVKSLDEMIRDVIASLQAGTRGGRPIYTLLLGSGFSFPIVPTPTQMLKSDIAWWRFCKDRRLDTSFRNRADAVAESPATAGEIAEFEKELWKVIHDACAGDEKKRFPIGTDGLPDLTDPENVGRAYDAVMSRGLLNDRMRRQYLRDAIARAGRKVNSAHIFLAGVLEVQETWSWGAPFCRTIFTTNFDPLLQRSLQLVNKLYYMTDRPEVLDAPDDDQSDAIHLIYTHGSVHRYGLLNTGDQIEKARRQNAAGLVGYLQRHGVIVMGYSGWRDTTMEALLSCSSFDSNLYWCDIHPADQAEARLRPEVLEVLRERGKNAYYVHIPSADEAMRQLHRALKLGDVPKFILEPVPTLIEQLTSIEVPTEPAGSTGMAGPALAGNDMATLLAGTLQRLNVAGLAFDDPSIVKASSTPAQNAVAGALIARVMLDALFAASAGKPEQAIALWSSVISEEKVPAADRAWALLNRGVTYGDINNHEEELRDYSAIIGMPDAPVDAKAHAFVNRSIEHNNGGRVVEAVQDLSAVIAMANAPNEQKAKAFINRGVMHGEANEIAEAIDDYTGAIELPYISAEKRAKALYNRGQAHYQLGRYTEALADYSMVTEMPDAPGREKAGAFVNRGWALFGVGDVQALLDDSRRALAIHPENNAARMNVALALLLSGETDAAITEYERLLGQTSEETVIREAVHDLQAEMTKRPDLHGAQRALALLNSGLEKIQNRPGGSAPP